MEDILDRYATASSRDVFWENLVALLTDEVVIGEAQAVGMDWPDFAEGRRRLVATRRVIVASAQGSTWITPDEAELLAGDDLQAAMAAARLRMEHGQLIGPVGLDGGAGG